MFCFKSFREVKLELGHVLQHSELGQNALSPKRLR